MQRVAILSDIHSNLQALRTVLARAEQLDCDTILCLGDIVGYGARPSECLELMRSLDAVCVQGNHDALVSDSSQDLGFNPRSLAAVAHNRRLLTAEQLAWLGALPTRRELTDGTVLSHGSPDDRDRYLLAGIDLDREVEEQERRHGPGLTFFGHTHLPVCHQGGELRPQGPGTIELAPSRRVLVNPGSVGQPRDGDPRAAFVLWDRPAGRLVFERLDYDIEAARAEILAAGLPERLGDRLRLGR
ncbi:MAG TPA: metallophosphoesterase family protein [Candidatus Krumholzibacteria bacterium]|nr:metallophosphoesterase family protein [Candidatus Krumholzibacteria bacterium]